MWKVNGYELTMAENDFGIALPTTVTGTTLGGQDCLKFVFKDVMNGDTILEKDFNDIAQNTVRLELTASESALFPIGRYVYRLDWYQNGVFMCNLIPVSTFKVVDKA